VDKLTTVTVRPTIPQLTDRDLVEAVWIEHCHEKRLGFKDLMLLALKRGREEQRLEDLIAFADLVASHRYQPPKAERDDVSIYDATPRTGPDFAADVDDPVRQDRRAIARQYR
jgi:hypothetical protein